MFSSIFGRRRPPAEQPSAFRESEQGGYVVVENPGGTLYPPLPVPNPAPPVVPETPPAAPKNNHRQHGIDGVPFELNVAAGPSGVGGEVDALLRRLRAMGDLSWTEYDYSVERRILRDYA
ncbi:uncharacterized protein LOC144168941 [Haemaphysalis longicornis]